MGWLNHWVSILQPTAPKGSLNIQTPQHTTGVLAASSPNGPDLPPVAHGTCDMLRLIILQTARKHTKCMMQKAQRERTRQTGKKLLSQAWIFNRPGPVVICCITIMAYQMCKYTGPPCWEKVTVGKIGLLSQALYCLRSIKRSQ